MISIIIPIYNVEKYLNKCIDSILNQTYSDLEIILVDDGSTDKSSEICEYYKEIDNRIRVIHKKNGGLSEARNVGIDIAKGEYIAFLDSDDWADENLYKRLYQLSQKYSSDISMCSFKWVQNEKEVLNKIDEEIVYSNLEALNKIYDKNYTNIIVAWNKLYHRKLFDNLRYPVGKIHEDEFLTPILIHRANKISITNKELIYYRQNSNSITNSKFSVKRLDYIYALENRLNYFNQNSLEKLYKKGVWLLMDNIIRFYYIIKNSDIPEKKQLMKMLKVKLFNIINITGGLSSKDKVKIMLFEISPNLFKRIAEHKSGNTELCE